MFCETFEHVSRNVNFLSILIYMEIEKTVLQNEKIPERNCCKLVSCPH
jgi:hypothetical protein